MKKTFRIAGALALCLTMIPAMVSCGDDEDEPGGGSSEVVEGTRLTSVNNVNISYDDKGRVYRFGSSSQYGYIDYEQGVISIPENEEGEMKVKFNGKGYISSLNQNWDYTEDGEWEKGSSKASFSYDGDGHLVQVTVSSAGEYDDKEDNESGKFSENFTIDLTWSNGNLTKVVEEGTKVEDGREYKWMDLYDLDYNMDLSNKFRQMTMSQFDCVMDDDFFSILACAGMFGVGSELLPSKIEENDDDGYSEVSLLSFSLNDNGTIAREKCDDDTYYYGYGNADVRSASGAKLFSAKKCGLFRSHRNRR